jgi:hypothetical protein
MIDFTKPIRCKSNPLIRCEVLFHDIKGVYYELSTIGEGSVRRENTVGEFRNLYENVPEAPKKIKGFIGILNRKDYLQPSTKVCSNIFNNKEDLIEYYKSDVDGIIAIVEINATEGEGLQ